MNAPLLLKPDEIDFSAWAYADERNRIVTPEMMRGELAELFDGPQGQAKGLRLPWSAMAGCFGVRPGEVTLWHGANGQGKSLVAGQAVLALMAQGAKSLVISLEIEPRVTLYRMARQAIGRRLPATPELQNEFIEWATGKLWVYARIGMVDLDTVLAVMNYAVTELGVTQFVIDSMMKLGMGVEDYTGQKFAVARLCDFAMAKQAHIHLVVHSRKPSDAEVRPPSKYEIKGAEHLRPGGQRAQRVAQSTEGTRHGWRGRGCGQARLDGRSRRHHRLRQAAAFRVGGFGEGWFHRQSYQLCGTCTRPRKT